MKHSTLAFVDIETTGSSLMNDKIIEIGIIVVQDRTIVRDYSSLVNPDMSVSPFIEMMTGIKKEQLDTAPRFEDIHNTIYDLLQDTLFIAHNVQFDYSFIKQEFKRLGLSFQLDHCCTVKLSRHLYPQYLHHNLDSLISRFNFECPVRHRAYSDAHVLYQFYNHVLETFPSETVESAFSFIQKKPSLPKHLNPKVIDNMPESPGIYIFYDSNKIPLYIGKSKNIKQRVLNHFTSANQMSKELEMSDQIHDIEFQITSGEFTALLLEAQLVKEMQPIYNRKLRKSSETAIVTKKTNPQGYFIPEIRIIDTHEITEPSEILAMFKTKKQAKDHLKNLVDEYQLCPILMGVEKGKGACFNSKIEKCQGACVGVQPTDEYNTQFLQAFEKTSITKWPFAGPVVISEATQFEAKGEKHLFNNWQYLGSIRWDSDSTSFNNNSHFDYDIYKILKDYIRKGKRIQQATHAELEALQ